MESGMRSFECVKANSVLTTHHRYTIQTFIFSHIQDYTLINCEIIIDGFKPHAEELYFSYLIMNSSNHIHFLQETLHLFVLLYTQSMWNIGLRKYHMSG